jgi:hypothetical protein
VDTYFEYGLRFDRLGGRAFVRSDLVRSADDGVFVIYGEYAIEFWPRNLIEKARQFLEKREKWEKEFERRGYDYIQATNIIDEFLRRLFGRY